MAEILEYALVVMVSTLFVAGSVLVYTDDSSLESGLSLRATFYAVSGLVSKAITNGTAGATMAWPPSTVSCRDGLLAVEVGSSSMNESIPLGCGFTVPVPGGTHRVVFRTAASRLGAWVD